MSVPDAATVAAIREIIREELADLLRTAGSNVPSVELGRPTDPTKQGSVSVKVYHPDITRAGSLAKEAFRQACLDADEIAPLKPK
jgi:hypothetical protein